MSTNRWSPYVQSACHYCKIIPFNVIQDLSASCHDLNHRQRLFCDNDWLSSFLFPLKSCFISFHFNFSAKIITFHTSPLITNLYLRFWSFHRATRTLLTLIYWCFFLSFVIESRHSLEWPSVSPLSEAVLWFIHMDLIRPELLLVATLTVSNYLL